jgi:putative hydrolase of the HAD superfamily
MGIIFDIDDTLIDHSGAEERAGIEFGQMFSERIPHYSTESFHGLWKSTSKKHFLDFLEGKITFDQQRLYRIKDIFQSSMMTDQEAKGLFNRYLEIYEESWTLFSDVNPFLEACRLAKIPLGVISDGSQAQQEKKLESTGIKEYFILLLPQNRRK